MKNSAFWLRVGVEGDGLLTLLVRARAVRLALKGLEKDYEKSEDDIKALQSVGQIIGEVLKQLDEERCTWLPRFVGGQGRS